MDDFRQVVDLDQVSSDDTVRLARTAAEAVRGLDFTNLSRPHGANISWLHRDRLRRGSGPTWPGLWHRGDVVCQVSRLR